MQEVTSSSLVVSTTTAARQTPQHSAFLAECLLLFLRLLFASQKSFRSLAPRFLDKTIARSLILLRVLLPTTKPPKYNRNLTHSLHKSTAQSPFPPHAFVASQRHNVAELATVTTDAPPFCKLACASLLRSLRSLQVLQPKQKSRHINDGYFFAVFFG